MTNIKPSQETDYHQIVQSVTRTGALLAGHRKVLELLAKRAPLFEILYQLVCIFEDQYEGLLCSILMVDKQTNTFTSTVEVSDSKNYKMEYDGVSILPPYIGPSSMAADTGEPVVIHDIAQDNRWQHRWSHWALKQGFKSCRSHPIRSSTGEVVAILVLYYQEPSDATLDNLYHTELATHIAGIAIERKLNESREIERLQRQKKLNEDLAHALNLRDEFLSVASHELNTPLTIMKAQTQIRKKLLTQRNEFSKEDAIKMLDAHEAQINRAIHLVEAMLDLSRFTSGRLEMKRTCVDLCALVKEVVARLEPQISQAGCQLTITNHVPLVGYWDQFRLEQVFTNLIVNATKYGAKKPIHISMKSVADNVQIIVKDNGIGIAEQDHQRIFNRYERVTRDRISVTGLGLGLHIVREIVEAHGGSIRVESQLGLGAQFIVDLPQKTEWHDSNIH